MRASWIGALLVILLAGCTSTPVYLSDLEGRDYTDVNSVLDDLDCMEGIVTFHIGEGASSEQEVLAIARGEVQRNIGVDVEQAQQRGEHIWLLATASDRVVGALDSRGGMAYC